MFRSTAPDLHMHCPPPYTCISFSYTGISFLYYKLHSYLRVWHCGPSMSCSDHGSPSPLTASAWVMLSRGYQHAWGKTGPPITKMTYRSNRLLPILTNNDGFILMAVFFCHACATTSVLLFLATQRFCTHTYLKHRHI